VVRRLHVTEKDFMHQVMDLAKLYNYLIYHTHNSQRSQPGYPDLCLVRPGRLVFLECKTEMGTLTPHQAMWLAVLNDSVPGVHALCVRPSDWDQLVEWLR